MMLRTLGPLSALASIGGALFIAAQARRALKKHRAALAEMREQLHVYDTLCRRQGDARWIFVQHQEGTHEKWVDIRLSVPGLSLRYPIRPEQMERFIALLRGEMTADMDEVPDIPKFRD